jgi:hypothetical protein
LWCNNKKKYESAVVPLLYDIEPLLTWHRKAWCSLSDEFLIFRLCIEFWQAYACVLENICKFVFHIFIENKFNILNGFWKELLCNLIEISCYNILHSSPPPPPPPPQERIKEICSTLKGIHIENVSTNQFLWWPSWNS